MPYTQSLLSNGLAIGYHAKAAPPTVTMPRLKVCTAHVLEGEIFTLIRYIILANIPGFSIVMTANLGPNCLIHLKKLLLLKCGSIYDDRTISNGVLHSDLFLLLIWSK